MDAKTIAQLVKTEETPFYVFDIDGVCERADFLKSILGNRVELCYAMKANPFLIEPLSEHVDSFEVCSPGEFHICERSKIPRERIVLSGVYKNRADMQYVLDRYQEAGLFTIESEQHLQILAEEAKCRNLKLRVLLRVTSGNQFGMDPDLIKKIICNLILQECCGIAGNRKKRKK